MMVSNLSERSDPSGGELKPRVDVMIGGVEKGGTTSLAYAVSQHPRILSHLSDDFSGADVEFDVAIVSEVTSREQYRETFIKRFGRRPLEGETVLAKSVQILHVPGAAERLYRYNPACRLVFSLRDPVERAYSSYWYQRWRGEEDATTFEEALQRERLRADAGVSEPDRMYVGKGEYARHLERILDLFEPRQVHVVLLEDLKENAGATINEVYDYLGLERHAVGRVDRKNPGKVPRSQWLAGFLQEESAVKRMVRRLIPKQVRKRVLWGLRRLNKREGDRPPMKPSTRKTLIEHFRPHNKRLEQLLDRDLSDWNRMDSGAS